MRIACGKTVMASPNGLDVHQYLEGEIYDAATDPPMSASLAETFVREGWGKPVPEPKAEPEEEAGSAVEVPVDTSTHDLTVPEVRELVATEEDVELLYALRRGEEQNPKGPRSGVLDALDTRIAELTE